MVDQADRKPRIVEHLPSIEGGVSALASANAPVLFFDGVGAAGIHHGVAYIDLQVSRFSAVGDGVVADRVTVAHLRMGLVAGHALKEILAKLEFAVQPVPDGPRN